MARIVYTPGMTLSIYDNVGEVNYYTFGETIFNGSSGKYFKIAPNFRVLSMDEINLKTVIRVYLDWVSVGGNGSGSAVKGYINGIQLTNTYTSISANQTRFMGSVDLEIPHDQTTGQGAIDVTCLVDSAWNGMGDAQSITRIYTNTYPRKSSVSCTDGYINDGGRPVVIHINAASPSFTHTLKYTFGSLSGTIADKYQYYDYGWILPESLYTQIPNSTSGIGNIICETWNGNNLIGTNTVNFTARVDENQNRPIISVSIVDTNKSLQTGYTTTGLTGNANKFIRGVSDAQVSVSATAKNSSSIVGYRIVNNSNIYNSNNFVIQNIEDSRFDVSATDSRGFVGYQNGNPTNVNMINYVPLTVNANVYRPEPTSGEVALSVSGNYFSGSFGSQNNSLEIKYRYKESTASWDGVAYKTITATIDSSNNKYSVSLSLGTTFDYQKSYDFEVVGTDKIQSIPKTYRVSEGIPMFAMFKDHLESFGNKLVDNNGNLHLPTTKSIYSGNNDILRHNGTASVLSSYGDYVYLRPNGTTNSTGQVRVDTGGNIYASAYYQNDGNKCLPSSNINFIHIVNGSGGYVELQTPGIDGITAFGVNMWSSDKRLKKNIADSKINALEIIKQLKHREFEYKNTSELIKIGYVADELKEIDKNLIFEVGKDKIKQPNSNVIIPILSKAIQEQQEYIEKLEERITKLEEKIQNI